MLVTTLTALVGFLSPAHGRLLFLSPPFDRVGVFFVLFETLALCKGLLFVSGDLLSSLKICLPIV